MLAHGAAVGLGEITARLEREGIQAFAASHRDALSCIEQAVERALPERDWTVRAA